MASANSSSSLRRRPANASQQPQQQRLQQQRRPNANYQNDRTSLLSGRNQQPPPSQQPAPSSGNHQREGESATSSLLRARSIIQSQLEQTERVEQAISTDGSVLRQTKEEQMGMSSVVRGAQDALSKLKLQENKETIILWSAVVFFYSVVAYILYIRLPIFG